MKPRPGVPRLLRELNDRAAFDVLLTEGPLTRTRMGELTGLSKVTAAQMLTRLHDRGLVQVVGEEPGSRGPKSALYAIDPSAAYVAGLEVGPTGVITAAADITGKILAEESVDLDGGRDPVHSVHTGIVAACESAGIDPGELAGVVIGTPGVIDPDTGDVKFAFDLPAWQVGLREALTADLSCPVRIENDVNLVALAEQARGIAVGVDDFALVWASRGVGLAIVIGGRLYRGRSGCAGEIGYLPVPGVPLASDVRRTPGRLPSVSGGLQTLVGEQSVAELAAEHGLSGATPEEWMESEPIMAELADRFALGVASVCVILDPGLVVLQGEIAEAGGAAFAARVGEAVGRICLVEPKVEVGMSGSRPVLIGAVVTAAAEARESLFA